MTSKNITIVFGSANQPAEESSLDLSEIARTAAQRFSAATVLAAPPLYDVTRFGPLIKQLKATDDNLVIIDLMAPRATFWRLMHAGIKGKLVAADGSEDLKDARAISCIDATLYDNADQLLDAVARIAPASDEDPTREPTVIDEAVRKRWYPIVDYDRCVGCLECLNFCLFGVYGLDEEDRLFVEEPDACRAGCPACARVCPSHAILFPRCPDQAIAGREEFETSPDTDGTAEKADSNQAANERSSAMQAMKKSDDKKKKKPDASADPLDQLIDEIDDMDL